MAQSLDYLYLDTGLLYRAVTWAALHRGIPIEDEAQISRLAQTLDIRVSNPTEDDGRQCTVYVERKDVTWDLRAPEVDHAVSPVSAYPVVRAALTQKMRAIAAEGDVVMVGRDIGTVVLPDADLKLYVVASAEERAHRRLLDNQEQGKEITYAEVLSIIKKRDRIDSNRATAPLRPADDAIIFDNTELSIEAMLQRVLHLVHRPIPRS